MLNGSMSSPTSGFTADDEAEVFRLAANAFSVNSGDLRPDSSPDNVKGWDSFAHIDFLVAIEKRFSVKLSPKEVMMVRNLGDAIAVLKRKRG